MNLGIFEASINIVQEAFEDLLLEKNGRSYREIDTIFGSSWGAASPFAKRSSNQELYNIYEGLVDHRNSRKCFEVMSLRQL